MRKSAGKKQNNKMLAFLLRKNDIIVGLQQYAVTSLHVRINRAQFEIDTVSRMQDIEKKQKF